MLHTYDMAGSNTAADAVAVASELTRLRHRGLLQVDLQTRQQKRLQLPELERLAWSYLGQAAPDNRPLLLRQYLDAALQAFAAAGSAAEAAFIRDLFFDTRTKPVGVLSQGRLRDAARKEAKLSDAAFRDLQRAHFREFAGFLLNLTSAKGVDSTPQQAAVKTLARYARAAQAESMRQISTWVGVETKSGVINIAPVGYDVTANDLQSLLTVLG